MSRSPRSGGLGADGSTQASVRIWPIHADITSALPLLADLVHLGLSPRRVPGCVPRRVLLSRLRSLRLDFWQHRRRACDRCSGLVAVSLLSRHGQAVSLSRYCVRTFKLSRASLNPYCLLMHGSGVCVCER
eukprot:3169228-Pleurochrysis_carterae.AAC.2